MQPSKAVLIEAFKCEENPDVHFRVPPEVQGKDFFGFMEDDWRTAFRSPPFLHMVEVKDNGDEAASTVDPRTLLVCLCFLYSPEKCLLPQRFL
jgi:hypothetical protein